MYLLPDSVTLQKSEVGTAQPLLPNETLCTLDSVDCPPMNMSGNVLAKCVCKVTFKHLPQPQSKHTRGEK